MIRFATACTCWRKSSIPRFAWPIRAGLIRSRPPALVRPVFERFKLLRNADENIYLRSGSVNVINGMVGLTFSCDGSHYMPVQDFLDKDDSFWFGTLTQ